jgi:hypothetical protein
MASDDPLPTDLVGAAFAKLLADIRISSPLESRHQSSAQRVGIGAINWLLVLGMLLCLAVSVWALLEMGALNNLLSE